MGYFNELPNIEYQDFLKEESSQAYILMKNIFIRGKLRDDLYNVFTAFDKYEIVEGERPDQIAEKLYGNAEYDWVVLVSANIINYQNQFPLSSQQLWNYVNDKYGEENVNDPHHYETVEVKDDFNRLILPGGLIVNEDFEIPDPNIPTRVLNPVTSVSNWEYEDNINNEKKTIYVLKRSYLNTFLRDMKDISKYGFNSEFVNTKTIRVENTKNLNP